MSSASQKSDPPASSVGSERSASAALRWRVWPIRDDRPAAATIAIAALGAWLVVLWVVGNTGLAMLVACLLVLSAWRLFLPAEIAIDARGIDYRVLRRHRRIPWHAIARCEVLERGVLVLPAGDNGPLDYFQGLYLPWRNHRDEVLTWLTRCLAPERIG